jgi:hypothetical protein
MKQFFSNFVCLNRKPKLSDLDLNIICDGDSLTEATAPGGSGTNHWKMHLIVI